MTPSGRLSWAVGGLALLLAGGVAAEALPPMRVPVSDSPSAPMTVAAATAPDAPPIDDWASTTLGRPLFALDRRPDAVVGPGQDVLPRLSGTIHFATTSLAIFQPQSADGSAKSVVVGQGATLSGWTITDIDNGGVTLMRDGRIASLRLSYANLPIQPRKLGKVGSRVLHGKRSNVFWQP
jgi:hypothetical protein